MTSRIGRGCQQTGPVNQRNVRVRKWKLGVRPQLWGLSVPLRCFHSNWRECAARKNLRHVADRAKTATTAAVKIMGVGIRYVGGVAPHLGHVSNLYRPSAIVIEARSSQWFQHNRRGRPAFVPSGPSDWTRLELTSTRDTFCPRADALP